MRLGIFGWSQSGKTTVFEALTGAGAAAGHPPAGKTHIGVARVEDERVDFLAGVFKPKKISYASVEYIDLPGLVSGSNAHEANPKALGDVRQAEALIAVVRAFEDPTVANPFETVDPVRDFRRLMDELVFADLEVADRRIARLEVDITKPTSHQKDDAFELACLRRVKAALEEGNSVSSIEMTELEDKATRGFRFLSAKPILVLLNLGEEAIGRPSPAGEAQFSRPTVPIFAKLELELSQLSSEDRAAFMTDLGLKGLAAGEVIRKGYEILDQISFLTAGDKEVRAWTIHRGTPAVQAAGAIHSDMERGFIRAEVVAWDKLVAAGSFGKARERAEVRMEGKDYVVQEGDVMQIRFNV